MSPAREKSLGEVVHGLCRSQGLPLQELAVLVGVSRPALYGWFNGAEVKPYYMKQLVEHLRPNDTEREELLRAAGYPLEYSVLLGASYLPAPSSGKTSPITHKTKKPRNPYKGLRAFTETDAGDFFGREQLLREWIQHLGTWWQGQQGTNHAARFLAVIGRSGAGKSSIVLAGLLPLLRNGALPGSQGWIYLEPLIAGERPLASFSTVLARQFPECTPEALYQRLNTKPDAFHQEVVQRVHPPDTRVVLVVDQFEQLFTSKGDERERRQFIDLIVTASTVADGPVCVILTLRADYFAHPLAYPALAQLIQSHQKLLPQLDRQGLRDAIEKPARLPDVKLDFDDGLVDLLLQDIEGQEGALPLLQFILDQLYEQRTGHWLTLQAYRKNEGIRGALGKQAEELYISPSHEEDRPLTKELFLRLTLVDRETKEAGIMIGRRAALEEFLYTDIAKTEHMTGVIAKFIRARLLVTNYTTDQPTLEVGHEALLQKWPRPAQWVREDYQDTRFQQTVSRDVAEWQRHGRPKDRLYRGSQLKEARAWAKRNTMSQQEETFLRASVKQRVRSVVSMISIVLLLFATAGSAAWFFMQRSPDPTLVTTFQNDGIGSLRWAIDSAPTDKTITFAPDLAGQNIALTNTLSISKKHLRIQGPGPKRLTISNMTHGIEIGAGASITLSGLILTGGKFNTASLLSNSGSLVLIDSTISDNTNVGNGGGISNSGNLTLIHSIVSNNTTGGESPNASNGGGIFNSGDLTLTNSTVSNNTTGGNGGGISNLCNSCDHDASLTLINSTVSGNTSVWGGGIFSFGSLTLTSSTVSGNSSSRGGGGGISDGGSTTLTNSTVSHNTGVEGGGIFNIDSMTLTNSTVSSNTSSQGGGISNMGDLTLTNCTISDNTSSSGNGGGLENYGGAVSFTFCTLYGNTAGTGGGLFTEDNITNATESNTTSVIVGSSTMRNTLIAGNQADNGSSDIGGNLTTEGYNLIQNTTGATFLDPDQKHSTDLTNISPSDIKIDQNLRLNGSKTTKTHALLLGSLAIDKVPLSGCLIKVGDITITTDQRGIKRPQGPACDIGAYEYLP